MEWQVVAELSKGKLLTERMHATPNPAIEILQHLADGTEIKVVWSYLQKSDVAKLVTVHYLKARLR